MMAMNVIIAHPYAIFWSLKMVEELEQEYGALRDKVRDLREYL